MGLLIARVILIGIFVFLPILALIYGWRKIKKEDFKHTAKLVFAGILTVLVILVLTLLENQ